MTQCVALRLDLQAEPDSVRDARAFVRDAVVGWGRRDLVDTAALLISELATNVVLHARTPYAVVLTRARSDILFDVLDDAPTAPAVRDDDLHAATGRGLALVERLADAWGATPLGALEGFVKGVRFQLS